MKISRRNAATTWMKLGIEDFIIAFEVLGEWPWQKPFFIQQGLEKICKAYLIGRKSSEYRKNGHRKARRKIHRIAQSFGHRVSKLIQEISVHIPTVSGVVGQNYDSYSGRAVLMVLERAYTETRYPVDESVSSQFPVKGTRGRICWDPLGSSSLEKCAFAISREIIEAMEKQFGVQFPLRNPWGCRVDDHAWERFCRLFLQREVLCEKCQSEKAQENLNLTTTLPR